VKCYQVSRRAQRDLAGIWDFIAKDSPDAADTVVADLYQAFRQLDAAPRMGHRRRDLTPRNVLFWPVYSYLVVYTDSSPLRIVRVLHGKRNVKKLLE
jgi:toxin ParE1/3/4